MGGVEWWDPTARGETDSAKQKKDAENADCIRILLSDRYRKYLTDWEDGMLEDISRRLRGKSLNGKQQEKLDEIWERVVVIGRQDEPGSRWAG